MGMECIFSLEAALAGVDDDREIFQAMAELFLEQGLKDLADAQAALATGDPQTLARAAHRLKGALLQFCAPTVLATTKELEELGKRANLDGAGAVCARLETELRQLLAALRETLDKGMGS